MTWVETNKEPPADVPPKDLEMINIEYELIEFSSNVAKELKKGVKRTKGAYSKFCRRAFLTYNWYQTSTVKILEALPKHEMFLKHLQDKCNEDEQTIQQVKDLDEKILKTEVAHATVSIHLLEDQLCLIPTRITGINT